MSQMRAFRRALRSAVGKPMAFQIRDGLGAALAPHLEQIARLQNLGEPELAEAFCHQDMSVMDESGPEPQRVTIAAGPTVVPTGKAGKATAIIPAHGVALYDVEWQPYAFSTLLLGQTVTRLAADPMIDRIIIDFDTPGGAVTGTPEAADAIFAAREQKDIIGLVNPLCCSAGLWLASQCTEIVATPSADVGSLGVFMAHTNCAKFMEDAGVKVTFIFAGDYKVEGNPYEALSEEALAYYQAETDGIYRDFLKAVARGRGMDVGKVEETFGKGRSMMAPMAKKVGMIDRVAPLDAALSRYGIVFGGSESRRRGEGEAPVPAAGDPPAPKPDDAPAEQERQPEPADASASDADKRSRKLALLSA